ncbi:MAG: hypothetical protein V8R01_06530 [Bacilli bacterium]
MAKITYADKTALNTNSQIADVNKVNDSDLNEIKSVVNDNDTNVGDLSTLNTTDKSSIVNAINELLPTVLYSTNKEFSEVSNNTIITLNDDITNYQRVVFFGISNNKNLSSVEVYLPKANDKIMISIGNAGNTGGYYAWETVIRSFTISSANQVTYGEGRALSSKMTSQDNLQGFVASNTNIKLYAIVGFKK